MEYPIERISKSYSVKKLDSSDIAAIYPLCRDNPIYYKYMNSNAVSMDSIADDLKALPPGKESDDKLYIGFFEKQKLIAVMDLIMKYPDEETAWIGFFMVENAVQRKGVGTTLIENTLAFLKKEGMKQVQLAYVLGNLQSESFWNKNHFNKTGRICDMTTYRAVVMERKL